MEIVYAAASWLATYAVHSSVLLCGAWILTRLFVRENPAAKDLMWKTAAVGAVLTASVAFVALPGPLQLVKSVVSASGLSEEAPEQAHITVTELPHASLLVDATGPDADAAFVVRGIPSIPATTGNSGGGKSGATFVVDLEPTTSSHAIAWTGANADLHAAALSATPNEAARALPIGRTTALTIVAIWFGLAMLLLIRLQRKRARFFERIGKRRSIFTGVMHEQVQSLADACDVDDVNLTTAPRLTSPAVLKAREICVPPEAFSRLDDEEQRSLVTHEFAHVLRRDPLWLRVFHFMECLFFFQPMNRVARIEFEEAAEELCDSWVVDRTGEPDILASCLVRVARWMRPEPQVGFAGIAGRPLRTRIERLVSGNARVTAMHPLGLASAAVLVFGVAAWGPSVAFDAPPFGFRAAAIESAAEADTIVVRFGPDVQYQFAGDGDETTFRGSGVVTLTARGTISSISEGGRMIVETYVRNTHRRVTATPTPPRAIAYEYEENGRSRPFAAAAQDWLRASISRLVETRLDYEALASRLERIRDEPNAEPGAEPRTRLLYERALEAAETEAVRSRELLEALRSRRLDERGSLQEQKELASRLSRQTNQLSRLQDYENGLQTLHSKLNEDAYVEQLRAIERQRADVAAARVAGSLQNRYADSRSNLASLMAEVRIAADQAAAEAVEAREAQGTLTEEERRVVREEAVESVLDEYEDVIAAVRNQADALREEIDVAEMQRYEELQSARANEARIVGRVNERSAGVVEERAARDAAIANRVQGQVSNLREAKAANELSRSRNVVGQVELRRDQLLYRNATIEMLRKQIEELEQRIKELEADQ